MEQKKGENGQKIAVGLISVIVCAALFYFFYYTKTPIYSVKQIGEAIQKHDVETFDRHVDLKHMMGKLYDDFVAKESKDQGSLAGNAFALGIVNALKPVAVAELQDAVYAEITPKEPATEQKESKINLFDRFKDSKNAAKLKDVSTISKDGDTAIVGIKYHNRKVDKDYSLKVKMEKRSDGKWRAKELTNLIEVLEQTEKDEEEKLIELDKPYKEQVWKTVELAEEYGWRLNSFYNGYGLEVCVSLKNISNKEIASASGFLQVEHTDAPYVGIKRFKMIPLSNIAPGQKDIRYTSLNLDSYDKTDKMIMRLFRKGKLNIRCYVMNIQFADGTKIVRPTKLPDPK